MSDKELLKLLGLEDRTISIGLDDEYARIVLEKKIDDYLKKLDDKKKKKRTDRVLNRLLLKKHRLCRWMIYFISFQQKRDYDFINNLSCYFNYL